MTAATPDNVTRALDLALDVSFLTKDMAMLKQALDKGGDAQRSLREGHQSNDMTIVDLAMAAGADINASATSKADGDTFLIAAVRSNNTSQAEQYLDRGADPNFTLGEKTAAEVILAMMKKWKTEGSTITQQEKALAMRLLAALPDQQSEADLALKKEVVLRAPQAAFKGAGQKPTP